MLKKRPPEHFAARVMRQPVGYVPMIALGAVFTMDSSGLAQSLIAVQIREVSKQRGIKIVRKHLLDVNVLERLGFDTVSAMAWRACAMASSNILMLKRAVSTGQVTRPGLSTYSASNHEFRQRVDAMVRFATVGDVCVVVNAIGAMI